MPAESTSPARAKRETLRERLVAGGTAIAEPDGGFPWLFAGIGAAAAIAAVTWFVMSGGSAATTANASEAPGPAPAVAGEGGGSAGAQPGADAEPLPAPVVDPRPRQRSIAVTALGQALAKEQLWATVGESGNTVVIRSAFCKDAALTARVSAARANLGALGFTAVHCLEQSGAVVFRESL